MQKSVDDTQLQNTESLEDKASNTKKSSDSMLVSSPISLVIQLLLGTPLKAEKGTYTLQLLLKAL